MLGKSVHRLSGFSLRYFAAASKNPRVFFDVGKKGDKEPIGRIVFELYADKVPKTAENFRSICAGDKKLTYKGSHFHRIIPQFMAQGGDITHGDGRGKLRGEVRRHVDLRTQFRG